MKTLNDIRQRRADILRELQGIEQMRRGSVTEQVVESVDKHGRRHRRGPYPLYTLKLQGRTVSRRIAVEQVPVYREQIELGRRFQELVRELMELGERVGDLETGRDAEKKTPRS